MMKVFICGSPLYSNVMNCYNFLRVMGKGARGRQIHGDGRRTDSGEHTVPHTDDTFTLFMLYILAGLHEQS